MFSIFNNLSRRQFLNLVGGLSAATVLADKLRLVIPGRKIFVPPTCGWGGGWGAQIIGHQQIYMTGFDADEPLICTLLKIADGQWAFLKHRGYVRQAEDDPIIMTERQLLFRSLPNGLRARPQLDGSIYNWLSNTIVDPKGLARPYRGHVIPYQEQEAS